MLHDQACRIEDRALNGCCHCVSSFCPSAVEPYRATGFDQRRNCSQGELQSCFCCWQAHNCRAVAAAPPRGRPCNAFTETLAEAAPSGNLGSVLSQRLAHCDPRVIHQQHPSSLCRKISPQREVRKLLACPGAQQKGHSTVIQLPARCIHHLNGRPGIAVKGRADAAHCLTTASCAAKCPHSIVHSAKSLPVELPAPGELGSTLERSLSQVFIRETQATQ
mmetsp:Transcript_48634/g.105744  ORF Transcript_48634/g.105744 Transcript_48634/m.105744 type:complete len:220 (-) Transcript_48634:635-1294(-)